MKSFLYIHIKTAFFYKKKVNYEERRSTKGYAAVTNIL